MAKKYKFALVGCGRIVKKHLDAIEELENAELTAVCDIDKAKAEKAASGFKGVNSYSSYDEMLQREQVDIVSILTPSGLHPEHTVDIVKKYKKHMCK